MAADLWRRASKTNVRQVYESPKWVSLGFRGLAKRAKKLCYNRVNFQEQFSNMDRRKIFLWLQGLVMAFGGGGLFVVTFFDSSLLSFPFFPDAVLIELCISKPVLMPYYASMAALGSLFGCLVLYFIAEKAGEAFFHKHAGGRAQKIKEWVDNNGFLSAFIPAILPPPFPFKPFILAEGVFQVPAKTFILAILLGRGLRYGTEGILAVRYGDAALGYLKSHGGTFALAVLAVMVVLYVLSHFVFRHSPAKP
ncbi:MAG TPA: VTT domain-containing protein [Candidatus Acidoferrales bacterium]|jgi:membrane protein YqaA with SNARE-associated domain